jgi:hypothetical protein
VDFEHLFILVAIPLKLLHFLHPRAYIAYFKGELQFERLAECMYQQGGEIDIHKEST